MAEEAHCKYRADKHPVELSSLGQCKCESCMLSLFSICACMRPFGWATVSFAACGVDRWVLHSNTAGGWFYLLQTTNLKCFQPYFKCVSVKDGNIWMHREENTDIKKRPVTSKEGEGGVDFIVMTAMFPLFHFSLILLPRVWKNGFYAYSACDVCEIIWLRCYSLYTNYCWSVDCQTADSVPETTTTITDLVWPLKLQWYFCKWISTL